MHLFLLLGFSVILFAPFSEVNANPWEGLSNKETSRLCYGFFLSEGGPNLKRSDAKKACKCASKLRDSKGSPFNEKAKGCFEPLNY